MSQAHKNRVTVKKDTMTKRRNEAILSREEARHERGMRMTKAAETSPKRNPSGSAKFDYLDDPLLGTPYAVTPLPSASHSARLRANKARGTQSSSTRVPVK
jgi:hypothetical protein